MKKVKVEVALLVNHEGEWAAAGWWSGDREDWFSNAGDGMTGLPKQERRFILTAEVEAPETQEITASVEAVERNIG